MTYSDDGNVGDIVGSHDREKLKFVEATRKEATDVKIRVQRIDVRFPKEYGVFKVISGSNLMLRYNSHACGDKFRFHRNHQIISGRHEKSATRGPKRATWA
jgi:hypothetical protein